MKITLGPHALMFLSYVPMLVATLMCFALGVDMKSSGAERVVSLLAIPVLIGWGQLFYAAFYRKDLV